MRARIIGEVERPALSANVHSFRPGYTPVRRADRGDGATHRSSRTSLPARTSPRTTATRSSLPPCASTTHGPGNSRSRWPISAQARNPLVLIDSSFGRM